MVSGRWLGRLGGGGGGLVFLLLWLMVIAVRVTIIDERGE